MMNSLNRKMKLCVIGLAAIVVGAVGYGVVVGAESPANDCLIGLEDQASTPQSSITCVDGAACDADGATNGSCTIRVRACLNIPGVAGCSARPIKKAKVGPPKLGITVSPNGSSSACGAFTDVVVKLKKKGKKPGKKAIKANVISDEKPPARDRDKLSITCTPCTDPSGSCSDNMSTTTSTTMVPPGTTCPANPNGGPDQLTMTVGATGNDLDTGFTGQSHNFLNVSGAELKFCLTGCDASTNSQCTAVGATGAGNLNGPTFGPPLPLFSANVAVCVVNRFQENQIAATVDVATGAFDATATPVRLLSDTYQGTSSAVCPRCVNNKCDNAARNPGATCHVDGSVVVNNPPTINNVTYNVSKDCLPKQSTLLGTPNVVLPLTTETSMLAGTANGNFPCPGQVKHDECGAGTCTVNCSSKTDPKGGINQTCCSSGVGLPCFPSDPNEAAGEITRTGSKQAPTPAWPDTTYPKSAPGTLAAVFCIPTTNSTAVDGTAGLPGPGTVLIAGTTTFTKNP